MTIWVGRIARALPIPQIEGKVAGVFAVYPGGHPYFVGVYGKVDEGAFVELEKQIVRVAVLCVLSFGVHRVLTGELVFKFHGSDGQAVEAKQQVNRILVFQTVLYLPCDSERVLLIQGEGVRVQIAGRFEISQLEAHAVIHNAMPDHIQHAAMVEFFEKALLEFERCSFPVNSGMLFPGLGLGGLDKIKNRLGEECHFAAVSNRVALGVAAFLRQVGSDGRFEDHFIGWVRHGEPPQR